MAKPDQAALANAPSAFGALLTPGAKASAKPEFAPLDFKPASAAPASSTPAAQQAAAQPYARMGSVLDLKV